MTLNEILLYVLFAVIGIVALGSLGLGGYLVLISRRQAETNRVLKKDKGETESLADQISETYREDDKPKVSFGVDGSGGSSPIGKKTRSVFSFATDDNEAKLNLTSDVGEDEDTDIIVDDRI